MIDTTTNEKKALKILEEVHAVVTDSHIVYTSGKHGAAYVNKDAVYPHTREISTLCDFLANEFANSGVDAVIAPAIGGVILSQWVAYHLTQISGREVLGLYAEKSESGDGFVIRRGYEDLLVGKRTLVVEDVLTTGGSAKKVIEVTRATGGKVIGLGVLCNRGGVKLSDVSNPPRMVALMNLNFEAWDESKCPLCAKGVPINTQVGKGRDYLARRMAGRTSS